VFFYNNLNFLNLDEDLGNSIFVENLFLILKLNYIYLSLKFLDFQGWGLLLYKDKFILRKFNFKINSDYYYNNLYLI